MIEFRGRAVDGEHKGRFVYGSLIHRPDEITSTIINDKFEAEVDNETIGFPSHTKDINGVTIYTGDEVTHDFEDNTVIDRLSATFTVVFEHNAFRKKYKDWDEALIKPILELTEFASKLRLKVIQKL